MSPRLPWMRWWVSRQRLAGSPLLSAQRPRCAEPVCLRPLAAGFTVLIGVTARAMLFNSCRVLLQGNQCLSDATQPVKTLSTDLPRSLGIGTLIDRKCIPSVAAQHPAKTLFLSEHLPSTALAEIAPYALHNSTLTTERDASNHMPCATTIPNSARCARNAFASIVCCRISSARVRCSMRTACWSALLTGTNRMFGRLNASQIASASMASFFPRLT